MSNLKNAAGSRTDLRTHNTEDVRVKVRTVPQQPSQRKWVTRLRAVAKLVTNPYLRWLVWWLWNNAGSILDWFCSNVGPF